MAATTNGVSHSPDPATTSTASAADCPRRPTAGARGSNTIDLGCDAGNPVHRFYTSVTDLENHHCNCTLKNTLVDCKDICLTAGGPNADLFCALLGYPRLRVVIRRNPRLLPTCICPRKLSLCQAAFCLDREVPSWASNSAIEMGEKLHNSFSLRLEILLKSANQKTTAITHGDHLQVLEIPLDPTSFAGEIRSGFLSTSFLNSYYEPRVFSTSDIRYGWHL
ncbi:hypothetical protein B0H19DRAFT_1303069 [Mycena capillaripes]|nr:hypothetical protein B0H19DRAFT_1303069 [Mycena capillaripes]